MRSNEERGVGKGCDIKYSLARTWMEERDEASAYKSGRWRMMDKDLMDLNLDPSLYQPLRLQ